MGSFNLWTPDESHQNELKCRLERMERRMSLLKSRDPTDSPEKSSSPPVVIANHEKGVKRKAISDVGNPAKRTTAKAERVVQRSRANRLKLAAGRRKVYNLPRSRRVPSKLHVEADENKDEREDSKNISQKHTEIPDKPSENILRTDNLYLIPTFELSIEEEEEEESNSKDHLPKGKGVVEVPVPTWRLHPVTNCYTLEGTENLEDEVFSRRHQKPETDEKRRKRWDIQRLREQRLYERLKAGRYASDKSPDKSPSNPNASFYPRLEDIDCIEVCDTIPVSAFGVPLPYVKPDEFQLPWYDPNKKPRGRGKSSKTKSR